MTSMITNLFRLWKLYCNTNYLMLLLNTNNDTTNENSFTIFTWLDRCQHILYITRARTRERGTEK